MVLGIVAGAFSIPDRSMTIEPRALEPDVQKYALDGALAVPDLGPYPEVSMPDKAVDTGATDHSFHTH